MSNQNDQDQIRSDTGKNILRRLIQVTMSVLLIAIVLFISAGEIEWVYAWVYIAASVLVIIINSIVFRPELISERGRKKENVEKWDKVISGLIIILWLGLYMISGLDKRFGWSSESALWIHFTGLAVFLCGNAFLSWAMISNNYFSTAVRIQYDRGHSVSKGGPYRYLRHPGYLGIIVYDLSTPLILGSVWAFLPAGLLIILFIIRTILEDSTLKLKLEGYKEYSERVKFRLIPFIW